MKLAFNDPKPSVAVPTVFNWAVWNNETLIGQYDVSVTGENANHWTYVVSNRQLVYQPSAQTSAVPEAHEHLPRHHGTRQSRGIPQAAQELVPLTLAR